MDAMQWDRVKSEQFNGDEVRMAGKPLPKPWHTFGVQLPWRVLRGILTAVGLTKQQQQQPIATQESDKKKE